MSLVQAHAACISALQSLQKPASLQSHHHLPPIRADFLSLLALIYAATTRLSLALKPSSPSPTAAIAPLHDISNNVAALSHSVRLLSPTHGSTLAREFSSAARDVLMVLKALLESFLHNPADDYLLRTAAVHDIIDHTRSTLSLDNAAAVQKLLAQNHASLDDGFQEVDAMIAQPDDSQDDGWSQLGLDSPARMTTDELERTKNVHAILRLSTLLHKRIIKDVSASTLHLDSLPPASSSLVVASDDLVSTLYPPQTPLEISKELAAFTTVINTLRSTILNILQEPSLADKMQTMTLQPSAKDPIKWFQTCFTQIQKAVDNLNTTLDTSIA